MKKFLIILMVLCTVSSAVFASGLSVNAGAGFDFLSGKTAKPEDNEAAKVSLPAVSVRLGGKYEFTDNLGAYLDADVLFPLMSSKIDDVTIKEMYDLFKSADKDARCVALGVKVHAGALYKLDLENIPVELSVGGGLVMDLHTVNLTGKPVGATKNYKESISLLDLGVEGSIRAAYAITDKVDIGLTINPQFMIFNMSNVSMGFDGEMETEKVSGIGLGFGAQAVVSGVYHF